MEGLTELMEKFQDHRLEVRETETLINLLIIDNKRLTKVEDTVQGVFDDLFEGSLKVRTDGNMTDWVDADEWLNERLSP